MPSREQLDPVKHPAGTRMVVADYRYQSRPELMEVVVVEWSPSGELVNLRYSSGDASWKDRRSWKDIAVIEVLPSSPSSDGGMADLTPPMPDWLRAEAGQVVHPDDLDRWYDAPNPALGGTTPRRAVAEGRADDLRAALRRAVAGEPNS